MKPATVRTNVGTKSLLSMESASAGKVRPRVGPQCTTRSRGPTNLGAEFGRGGRRGPQPGPSSPASAAPSDEAGAPPAPPPPPPPATTPPPAPAPADWPSPAPSLAPSGLASARGPPSG